MADKLLSDILNGHIELDTFYKWISGTEVKDINTSVNRIEFVLYILNYIQEEANKYIGRCDGAQGKSKENEVSQVNVSGKKAKFETKTPVDGYIHKFPFQANNKLSPSKDNKQPFTRNFKHGNETSHVFNTSFNRTNQSMLTSTPVRPKKNYSAHDEHFLMSPPQSSCSYQSDNSSLAQTPRSSKSSATKFHSSGSSHHLSSQSSSPLFSPTSPQYSESFPDLGSKNRRVPQSPSLADFIISKPSNQKSRKRIKPTQLTPAPEKDFSLGTKKGNNSFEPVNRPFIPIVSPLIPQSEVNEKSKFEEERSLLKQMRAEVLNISTEPTLPSPIIVDRSNLEKEQNLLGEGNIRSISDQSPDVSSATSPIYAIFTVNPDPSLISCMDKIVKLASVYSACLDKNLVPNIISELYLILTLLTCSYKSSRIVSGTPGKESVTIDNSVKEISDSKQCNVSLQNLHLKDEPHIIDNVINDKTPKNSKVLNCVHDCVMFASVVIEKQIIFIQWLDKNVIKLLLENARLPLFVPHFIPQLTHINEFKETSEKITSPMRKLTALENGPVLYHNEVDSKDNFTCDISFHSFKKQRDKFYELLCEWRLKNTDTLWCSKRFPVKVEHVLYLSDDPVNTMHFARLFCAQLTSSKVDQNESELDIPGVNKDKLSRLEARFSKPQETTGSPRPELQFPGEQQFYRQFLELAADSCSTFLTHVVDCLIFRLNQLDSTVFFMDGLSVEESKAQLYSCVTSCCLLGKFLGFILFRPYRTKKPSSPDLIEAQMLVRQLVVPPINVVPYLQKALVANRLIVTVPWIVSFLGMMDPVTPYLMSYRGLLQQLVSIYRALPFPHVSPLSSLLLRCLLGWLFDVSFFPEDLFFSLALSSYPIGNRSSGPDDVDVKNIVDYSLVLELCPFLRHVRRLLSTNARVNRGVRHITPVPAQLTPSIQTNLVQTMEFHLEESFLNAQAPSFRTTVDFVVDRISSSCIKHICTNVVAPSKEQASSSINEDKNKFSKMNKKEKEVFLEELCKTTEDKIDVAVSEDCRSKVKAALSVMLGPDISDSTVLVTTEKICGRRCKERITNWLNVHINLREMFLKVMCSTESRQSAEITLKPLEDRQPVDHRVTAMSPPDLLIKLQDTLCQCIDNRGPCLSEQQVLDLISATQETMKFRGDLIVAAEYTIYTLTVDLCIVFLAYSPQVVTGAVLQQLCSFWSSCDRTSGQLERIMSARNVLLLCQSGSAKAKLSWEQLSHLLVALLRQGLLTPQQLETQCIALFRQDWPPMVLALIRACLSSVVEQLKQDTLGVNNPKLVLMLEWVKEMTEDLSRDEAMDT